MKINVIKLSVIGLAGFFVINEFSTLSSLNKNVLKFAFFAESCVIERKAQSLKSMLFLMLFAKQSAKLFLIGLAGLLVINELSR